MLLSINPDIEIKKSPIQGMGLFTRVPIKNGETLWISKRTKPHEAIIFDQEEFNTFKQWCIDNDKEWDAVALGEGNYRAAVADRSNHPENYGNHSCNPNLDKNHIALRDIYEGEELTLDYSQFSPTNWEMKCNCGSPNCVGTVKGII